MPSPRMPASPREAPSTVHSCSVPSRSRAARVRPPGPRSSDATRRRRPRSSRDAGQAGHRHVLGGLERERDVAAARARVPASAPPCARRARSGFQPSRDASQPQKQQRRRPSESGAVADGDLVERVAARGRSAGGSNVGGDPLAPRRRAQPGEVDDVGCGRESVDGARERRAARPARPDESISTTCAASRARSASTASGWPCGDQTTVARSVTTQRVDDRVEHRRGAARRSSSIDALAQRARARPASAASSAAIVAVASSVVRPGSTRADDRCATGGSGRRLRAGSRPRRATRGRRPRPGSARARGRRRRSSW